MALCLFTVLLRAIRPVLCPHVYILWPVSRRGPTWRGQADIRWTLSRYLTRGSTRTQRVPKSPKATKPKHADRHTSSRCVPLTASGRGYSPLFGATDRGPHGVHVALLCPFGNGGYSVHGVLTLYVAGSGTRWHLRAIGPEHPPRFDASSMRRIAAGLCSLCFPFPMCSCPDLPT